jgi:hypothetical protein
MIHFSFHVYPARGHAVGMGGNGEQIRGGHGSRVVRESEEERGPQRVEKSERSEFIDQVLEKIRRRKMVESKPEARREAA